MFFKDLRVGDVFTVTGRITFNKVSRHGAQTSRLIIDGKWTPVSGRATIRFQPTTKVKRV